MKLKPPRAKPQADENLVPLINIVFLILIFFLVASTIQPLSRRDVTFPETVEASAAGAKQRVLVLTRSGTRLVGGTALDDDALARQFADWAMDRAGTPLTVIADAELDASILVDTVTALKAAGVGDVELLTRRVR